jgi:predicted transcriptional regulator
VAIDLGESGESDDENVFWPTVLKDDDAQTSERYKMWYTGYDGVDVHIMYATSADGINWEKQGVVMNKGSSGEPDDIGLYPSTVLKGKDGSYKMWYSGLGDCNRILYVTSPDGKTWTRHGVVLDIGLPGSLDVCCVSSPSVILDENGIYHMWYSGGNADTDRIFYATSFDGVCWFRQGLAVDLGPPGSYDETRVSELTVIKDCDGYYKMWYIGSDGKNNRMMHATLPLSSIDDYHFDFDSSNEGFSKENDYPKSEVCWDSQNQNVYLHSNRTDSGDEILSKPLPRILSSDSDSWTLTARWSTTERGNWHSTFPVFLAGIENDNAYTDPNSITISYGSGDHHPWMPYPVAYHLIYRGDDGTMYLEDYVQSAPDKEHHFYISYDATTKNLTMEIRGINELTLEEVTLKSVSYIIGTNPDDGFTVGKIGVASQGLSISEEPEVTGWTDDINLTISQKSGSITSKPITLPEGGTWSTLNIDKTEFGSDNLISVSILDAETNQVIPGFEELRGNDFDISSIDPNVYPAIKLRAAFMGDGLKTPSLNEWKVTWLNDFAASPITPEEPNEIHSWPGIGMIIGIIAGILLLSLFSIARTEVGKWKLIPFISPLYTRLKKEDILDQGTRSIIYRYILTHPGDHYNSIKFMLQLNNGVLAYHLKTLERENYIKSMRDGIYKRFYPVETKVPRVNGFGLDSIQGKIISELFQNPGSTQKELSNAIKISQQTVSYHLKMLMETGHVRAHRQGKTYRYFAYEFLPRSNM